jgi:hypothetical protein
MLELRPSCEHCNTALPPDSAIARICSFECTFCANCVDQVLANVCPNCAGGFTPRPVRPAREWKSGISLATRPATTKVTWQPVDSEQHALLTALLTGIAPAQR